MPKRRKAWTVKEKVDIIQWHRLHGSNQTATADEFGCGRKSVREWDNKYDELLQLSDGFKTKKL